jgi:Predicted transcriptional regulators
MISKDKFEILSMFGLTPYEIKLYTILLEHGPMKATDAAAASKVPQPRVYDTFKNLIDKGFVNMNLDVKRVYRAVDPKIIISKKMSEMVDSGEKVKAELMKLGKGEEIVRSPSLWTLKNGELLGQIRDVIGHSANEIVLTVRREMFFDIVSDLLNAAKRGVSIALYIVGPDKPFGQNASKLLPYVFLKQGSESVIELCISDQKIGILHASRQSIKDRYCLRVEEAEIVHILSYYVYHSMWYNQKTESIPQGVTRFTFSTIWFACDSIRIFQDLGYDLQAEVQGFRDEVPVVLKGKVDHVEKEFGVRNTLFIKTEGKLVSVGGTNKISEEILMKTVEIRILNLKSENSTKTKQKKIKDGEN